MCVVVAVHPGEQIDGVACDESYFQCSLFNKCNIAACYNRCNNKANDNRCIALLAARCTMLARAQKGVILLLFNFIFRRRMAERS